MLARIASFMASLMGFHKPAAEVELALAEKLVFSLIEIYRHDPVQKIHGLWLRCSLDRSR
jgi:hypothetical protein